MSPDADRAIALVATRPPTLGEGRLLCIDGPAGSGKTTLAGEVAGRTGATVVHLDDMLPGWDGLEALAPLVVELLEPLSRGHRGRYRRWDWHASRFAEEHEVLPSALLVLEGVSAGRRRWAHWSTALAWVETDAATARRRGLARDGASIAPFWARWVGDEQLVFAEERTRSRADLVVTT